MRIIKVSIEKWQDELEGPVFLNFTCVCFVLLKRLRALDRKVGKQRKNCTKQVIAKLCVQLSWGGVAVKLISWNVNGIRACMKKGFEEFFKDTDADVFCLQETKIQKEQIPFEPERYHAYWNFAQKKGYSGTGIFTKEEPLGVTYGMGKEEHDNPKSNEKKAGFSPQEREKFGRLLDSGFVDTFRPFYPDKEKAYTWWSYMFNARADNVGWRIDYFCISESLEDPLEEAIIYHEVMGSDHCPVGLVIRS